MELETRVTQLNRVGNVLGKRLRSIGIQTVKDLLFYFPFRYEDFSKMSGISDLVDGQQVTVKAKIEVIASRRSSRKRKIITEAVVTDGVEQLQVIWFGQPFISKTLKAGDQVYLSGKIKSSGFGFQLVSPTYEKVKSESSTHTARIVPIYHLTSGITQKQIRFLAKQAVEILEKNLIQEWLPKEIQKNAKIIELNQAIKQIHFPENNQEQIEAEKRLKFDELFILQLRAEMIRQSLKLAKAQPIKFLQKKTKEFVDSLGFELTKDQKIAAWEILQDIEESQPMNRLLEGDVGSGKTVVAAMALHSAALNKIQSTIMAPTEILAVQHFESLSKLFGEEISIGLLTRSECRILNRDFISKTKKGRKEELFELSKKGKLDILVGTHAILSEALSFKNLGLVIVDEQHRFGVKQRKKIREQSGDNKTNPHFLSMTATPIPRSFALTLYGDLDVSIIREMPQGRKKIKTRFADPHKRALAYDFIKDQVGEGRQVFVICLLIENENSEKASVLAEYKKLSDKIFPEFKIEYLHGKMKSKEKEEIMKGFSEGKTDILVSTSVVEVGVDIPNASVMMIEGAENFGLAQLHQFRGRVGRSSHQSYCFVFSDSDSEKARERLNYFEKIHDGFDLAEYDLQVRGPGEVYGTSQSGMMNLKIATMHDAEIIKKAREIARGIDFKKYSNLKEKVKAWETRVHLE